MITVAVGVGLVAPCSICLGWTMICAGICIERFFRIAVMKEGKGKAKFMGPMELMYDTLE